MHRCSRALPARMSSSFASDVRSRTGQRRDVAHTTWTRTSAGERRGISHHRPRWRTIAPRDRRDAFRAIVGGVVPSAKRRSTRRREPGLKPPVAPSGYAKSPPKGRLLRRCPFAGCCSSLGSPRFLQASGARERSSDDALPMDRRRRREPTRSPRRVTSPPPRGADFEGEARGTLPRASARGAPTRHEAASARGAPTSQ